MFDFESYKGSCNTISQLVRKGRGGIYLGGFDVLGASIFGHQIITDSRHFDSIKTLYIPSPVEISVIALMFKIIKTGMVCVDVGAGCGYYTIVESSLAGPNGKIYSFEIVPECFDLLKKNMEINEIQTVHCVNRLVSDGIRKEKQTYFGGNYEFFFLNADDQKERVIEVETISLDKYFEDKETIIDFVKINIISHLPAIFKGMSDLITFNPHIKILAVFNQEKILAAGQDLDAFFNDIKKKGLEMFLLPTLQSVDKEELLEFNSAKSILIAKSL